MPNLTPLKAIRKHCLFCMNNQFNEVKICTDRECPLWLLRFGKGAQGVSVLKAIRVKCYACGEGTPSDIKNCEISDCFLYRYRFGKNPALKGRKVSPDTIRALRAGLLKKNLSKTGILELSTKEQLAAS